VHTALEDLILEFRTGKFVRSLPVFTSLSVKVNIYNLYPPKTDKIH
jgi:hypothetical protein